MCIIASVAKLTRSFIIERYSYEEKRLAEESAACRLDLQCTGDKQFKTSRCRKIVESYAEYDYEWIDGWLEVKFDRYQWGDDDKKTIIYGGDKIKFQNGFGAWQRYTYLCRVDLEILARQKL